MRSIYLAKASGGTPLNLVPLGHTANDYAKRYERNEPMTDPLSLETVLSKFSEDADAWVLKEASSEQYVAIPHPKYPGRRPLHFFMSRSDAEALLSEILDVNPGLRDKNIFPAKVKLLQAVRAIAQKPVPGGIDGFVVHPPNEVFEFMRQQKL